MGKNASNKGLNRKVDSLMNLIQYEDRVLALDCQGDLSLAKSAYDLFKLKNYDDDCYASICRGTMYACRADSKEHAMKKIDKARESNDMIVVDTVRKEDKTKRIMNASFTVQSFYNSGDDIKEITGMHEDPERLRKSMANAIRNTNLQGKVVCYINSDRVFLSRGYEQSDCIEPAVISDPVDPGKVLESAQDLMHTALALKDNGCSDIAEELLTIINDLNRRVLDL